MRFSYGVMIVLGAALAANAQGGPGGGSNSGPAFTLKIPNEIAPPGGVAQMKFLSTEPTPISSGRPHGLYDETIFDAVYGIEVFNPNGDLNGVAIVDGPWISVNFTSTASLQGTDYPVMTMALHVRPTAVPGAKTQFNIDPSTTFSINNVPATLKPIAPATIMVGGGISIVNVVPGGGLLPAGTVVKVEGLGFQPRTQVQLSNVKAQKITVVSSTEIDITLAQATDMSGKKIQVVNPDGSQDTYFSYLRGINFGVSNWPLLGKAVSIFSSVTHTQATFSGITPSNASQFSGVAVQNPGLDPVNVTVSVFSAKNAPLGSATILLPGGYRLMREIYELAGAQLPAGGYLTVSASHPVQVFTFVADTAAGTITPFAAH